ncbi:MAG: type VI secretion lipoprotein TssJ [Desulfovibrio sp.]|uniref:type VI secretion lipoprotein TssJ n=1 Tax=Desulfovibrio sp. 7SRBS1 TaxID=3378064 RepID=UPI003B3C30BE
MPHRMIPVLLILLLAAVASGCSGSSSGSAAAGAGADSMWAYQPNSIQIRFKSDPQLNMYDGKAHALTICLYQLGKPNAFNDLAQSPSGIGKLLECSRFDQTVSLAQQIFIQPNEDKLLYLDRGEGAKYVALVAGYYTQDPISVTRLYQIPVKTTSEGWLFPDVSESPETLFVNLLLGPNEIQRIGR